MNREMMQNILNSIHYLLENFSDGNKQYIVWNGLSPEYADSFDESVESLYDFDFDEILKENHTWYEVNEELHAKMTLFSEKLLSYAHYVWAEDEERNVPALILADPRWHDIQHLAKEIIDLWDANPPKLL